MSLEGEGELEQVMAAPLEGKVEKTSILLLLYEAYMGKLAPVDVKPAVIVSMLCRSLGGHIRRKSSRIKTKLCSQQDHDQKHKERPLEAGLACLYKEGTTVGANRSKGKHMPRLQNEQSGLTNNAGTSKATLFPN